MASTQSMTTMQDFLGCCGSTRFATEMARVAPFSSLDLAVAAARDIWWNKVDIPGWLEAFAAHPRIGDVDALRTRFASPSSFCEGEQEATLTSANEHTIQLFGKVVAASQYRADEGDSSTICEQRSQRVYYHLELAEWNRQYETKFGFVFLICASGKSSTEILSTLKERYCHRPMLELEIAASEQQKITELRLAKLMSLKSHVESSPSESKAALIDEQTTKSATSTGTEESDSLAKKANSTTVSSLRPPITTHVLDVALGKPGSGIDVSLHWWTETSPSSTPESNEDDHGFWAPVGKSVTNDDGRAGPLMPTSNQLQPGKYQLTFNTGAYLGRVHGADKQDSVAGFYPYIVVVFDVKPSQASEHFHIPVLLAPYSYSTYRGS